MAGAMGPRGRGPGAVDGRGEGRQPLAKVGSHRRSRSAVGWRTALSLWHRHRCGAQQGLRLLAEAPEFVYLRLDLRFPIPEAPIAEVPNLILRVVLLHPADGLVIPAPGLVLLAAPPL